MAIVVNCILTFLMMSFNSAWVQLWEIAYVCDTVMMVNILVGFFVEFVDDRGISYVQREIIARKYLRSLLVVDVLSVLPYDYFPFPENTHFALLAMLRLNRLIGLIRVFKFLGKSNFPTV